MLVPNFQRIIPNWIFSKSQLLIVLFIRIFCFHTFLPFCQSIIKLFYSFLFNLIFCLHFYSAIFISIYCSGFLWNFYIWWSRLLYHGLEFQFWLFLLFQFIFLLFLLLLFLHLFFFFRLFRILILLNFYLNFFWFKQFFNFFHIHALNFDLFKKIL